MSEKSKTPLLSVFLLVVLFKTNGWFNASHNPILSSGFLISNLCMKSAPSKEINPGKST